MPKFDTSSVLSLKITNEDYKCDSDETLSCEKRRVINDQSKITNLMDKRRLNGIIEELANQLLELKGIFGERIDEIERKAILLLTE